MSTELTATASSNTQYVIVVWTHLLPRWTVVDIIGGTTLLLGLATVEWLFKLGVFLKTWAALSNFF